MLHRPRGTRTLCSVLCRRTTAQGIRLLALGHVHTRETLSDKPFIAFPGNIQGRHIRETGPKGCLLVSVDESHSCDVEFRPLDVVRWGLETVDVSEAVSVDDVLTQCSERIESAHETAEGRILACESYSLAKLDCMTSCFRNDIPLSTKFGRLLPMSVQGMYGSKDPHRERPFVSRGATRWYRTTPRARSSHCFKKR